MSRSGYNEDCYDNWQMIMYRGRVASATKGRRGQKFFQDLLLALDAMPEKRLIDKDLERPDGEVCAIGALGRARGVSLAHLDPEDACHKVAEIFNIAECLAREVVFMNDEGWYEETPEQRWTRMRRWVEDNVSAVNARGPRTARSLTNRIGDHI